MKTVEFERPDGKKLNIEIIKYQIDDADRKKQADRHRHNFFSIHFILAGQSKQEIDFEDFEIKKNQIVLIPSGSVHWEKENQDLSGYAILFKAEFFSPPQKELLNGLLQYAIALRKLLIPIEEKAVQAIIYYFELLMKEQDNDLNQNQTFILQNLMLALLNHLEGQIQQLPKSNSFVTTRRPFQRFIELVDHHYYEHQNLEFYAEHLQITKRKLSETVKSVTGQTAADYIIERITLEAKRELCFNEKSVKEIAFQLGYESPYYFSRIFKKRTGLSPEQFRTTYAE